MTSLCALIACSDFPSLAALLTIYAVAAVLSGLSGFGFSAIGCLSFAVLSPELAVAMLMGLSLLTQAFGAAALWAGARREPNATRSFFVGAAGGLVGGFSAFQGSALVVWNARAGAGKEQGRALTQALILSMQVVGLALLLARHPALFGLGFWRLFVVAAPLALVGNRLGIAIYRRTGDTSYRRVTLFALGAAGFGLLVQIALV